MGKTKKVGKAGRFKARYGVGIRKKLAKVESRQKLRYSCPQCGFVAVKRLSKGVFNCNKCSHKFAGGAYFPLTMSGNLVRKMVQQKSFLPNLGELLEAKETQFDELEQLIEDSMNESSKVKPVVKREENKIEIKPKPEIKPKTITKSKKKIEEV
jgi:large subunit ribosomal protein L37Ae